MTYLMRRVWLGAVVLCVSCANQSHPGGVTDSHKTHTAPLPRREVPSPPAFMCEAPAPSRQVPDGTPVPGAVWERVAPKLEELRRALAKGDQGRVDELTCQARRELGPWQGVAESAPRFRQAKRALPDVEGVYKVVLKGVESKYWDKEPWVRSKLSTRGEEQQGALRRACVLLDVYMVLGERTPSHQGVVGEKVRQGLEWLMKVQHQGGQFPYPDLSAQAATWLSRCQSKGAKSLKTCQGALPRELELSVIGRKKWERQGRPSGVMAKGWFVNVDRLDPGGLQFDTGVCGKTLVRAFDHFGDVRYLEAAKRAGRWAAGQPVVLNANYNAFSVELLTLLAQRDPGSEWLPQALKKARLGVLPGLMPDGRWFDPHNARMVYHMILTRSLVVLQRLVKADDIEAAAALAVGRVVREVEQNGGTALSDGIETMALAKRHHPEVEKALGVMVNAALPQGVPSDLGLVYWVELAKP